MNHEVTLEVEGARVVIPASTLTSLWLERVRGPAAIARQPSQPKIGTQYGGGTYAGIIRGVDGAGDQQLIVLEGDREDMTWQDAKDWAEFLGGGSRLPTRREQAVLFGNVPELFAKAWYWSNETHASSPECAWCQLFSSGDQYGDLKVFKLRARAVRTIQL